MSPFGTEIPGYRFTKALTQNVNVRTYLGNYLGS